jgi:ankyrin repeat protein
MRLTVREKRRARNLAKVRAMIAASTDVNAQCAPGGPALLYAAYQGRNDVIRTLLEAGANLRATNGIGENVVIEAAYEGHADTIRLLVAAGANVNARGATDSTALSRAVNYGHTETVQTLLELGADPSNGLTEYGSPLTTASHLCKVLKTARWCNLVEVLKSAGAKD